MSTNLFLSKGEVDNLTYAECCEHLRTLKNTWDFERNLQEFFADVWPILDELTNTVLFLEDRISRYEDPRIFSMNMSK